MRNYRDFRVGAPPNTTLQIVGGGTREAGSQITLWSCVPASLEYACIHQLGCTQNPVMQEVFFQCAPWMTEVHNGAIRDRTLMPWDPTSWNNILSGFKVRVESVVTLSDPQVFGPLSSYMTANSEKIAALVQVNNFENQSAHCMVLFSATPDFCTLVIPIQPDANNRPTEVAWANYGWNEIARWGSQVLILRQ